MSDGKFSFTTGLSLEVLLLFTALLFGNAWSQVMYDNRQLYAISVYENLLIMAFHNNAINIRYPRIVHSRMVSNAYSIKLLFWIVQLGPRPKPIKMHVSV